MTLPTVTEIQRTLEQVDRDTFIDAPEHQAPAGWQLPSRRPADA